ncbi:RICIN domain-containing protein [Pseudomonas gingeri]|uniref:RICIN domain-containing protein n=1 Tax=Pseudomonas gingeri TaxID=117681 RepID=A0A7Y7Y7N7_9PSED|nr:RICIN domain-containing protein [Pseudomonas gingeri]NWB29866.1 RICIN domain-containing protein [Pseudomonas gingeri]NWC30766.1 RICIN domain-containing protein [Pseudomonas gingeri]NWD03301.1 RICIN domain-containing protein [Pseudomonas gingeri]NWD50545.1 RICIN domain-containing protein [Pseudomonas gingeri]NWE31422.1 RICIN domain-containing protein [Pseudomonas gingeri]
MQDEIPPIEGETSEQTPKGAPGSAVRVPDGIYKIHTALSNGQSSLVDMYLNGSGSPSYRHGVKLYHNNNEPESTWRISYRNYFDGYIIYNGKLDSRTLEAVGPSDLYASALLNTSPNLAPQTRQWIFKSAGSPDNYYIECKLNGNVLDVRGSQIKDNTPIIHWPYHGTVNQRFILVKL